MQCDKFPSLRLSPPLGNGMPPVNPETEEPAFKITIPDCGGPVVGEAVGTGTVEDGNIAGALPARFSPPPAA